MLLNFNKYSLISKHLEQEPFNTVGIKNIFLMACSFLLEHCNKG